MPTKPLKLSDLLTREDVIAELLREIDQDTQTVVAKRYGISDSQLSDIKRGQANLSKRVLKLLRYRIFTYYQRVGRDEKL